MNLKHVEILYNQHAQFLKGCCLEDLKGQASCDSLSLSSIMKSEVMQIVWIIIGNSWKKGPNVLKS